MQRLVPTRQHGLESASAGCSRERSGSGPEPPADARGEARRVRAVLAPPAPQGRATRAPRAGSRADGEPRAAQPKGERTMPRRRRPPSRPQREEAGHRRRGPARLRQRWQAALKSLSRRGGRGGGAVEQLAEKSGLIQGKDAGKAALSSCSVRLEKERKQRDEGPGGRLPGHPGPRQGGGQEPGSRGKATPGDGARSWPSTSRAARKWPP